MAPRVAEIIQNTEFKPENLERISFRSSLQPIEILPSNPTWSETFSLMKGRIVTALGDKAVEVHHTGSTSIPDLPAKDVIDIDLVVPDIRDEAAYVEPLEQAGFQFLFREPPWHGHRFFVSKSEPAVNLHVWGPDCPEVTRHLIFQERLLRCPEDKALYWEVKMDAARATREAGGDVLDYNLRKQSVIRQILRRAFMELGYLDENDDSSYS